MALQGPRIGPYPSNSATIADLPRPTSPDLQTDSDDDATSSDSDEDHPIANGRKNAGKEEQTVRRDLVGKTYDDSRKPRPRNRDEEDLVRAVQERIRVQSLLYDAPSSTTTTRQQSPGPPPISRAHLRLALSTLRARHSLASRSFSHLSTALNEISKALLSLGGPDALAKPMLERRIGPLDATASTKPNFGIFIPILARLVKDVRTTLSAEGTMGREFRRSNLSREEAKALVALRQRWVVKSAGGKPTGREGKRDRKDSEWVDTVEKLVAEHPPPACLLTPSTNAHEDPLEAEAEDPQTASLLTSIEQLLLPAALPRISLSNLDLDDHDLADWPALEGVEEIVRWYLSFGYAPGQRQEDMGEEEDKAREVLDGVKVLDLSHNRLADFPRHLVHLFPNLEALSLSHNRFTRLPPWITLFSSLRRLETNHNSLVSSSRDDPARTRTSRAAVGKGKGKGEENDGGDGVRANAREMYKLVEAAVRRTVTRVSRAELLRSLHCRRGNSTARTAAATGRILEPPPPLLRSLFSLSVELAQTHLLSSPSQRETCTLDDALSMMIPPPHLLEAVTTSYRCNSCDRFVTTMPDDAAWFVPPFWERVHFLTPGIVVPSSHGLRRRDRRRRRRRGEAERGDEDEEDDDDGEEGEEHVEHLDVDSSSALSGRGDSGAVKSATLEQRLLLAVLARQEQGSLPPPPPDRGPQRSSGTSGGGGGHKKKNAASSSSRFFDSDYGRRSRSTDHDGNADDPAAAPTEGTGATFVIGGRGPHGVGFRFCSLCAASHLGVRDAVLANIAPAALGVSEGYEDGGADVVASWTCECEMCEEERRVRGTASEEVEEDNVDERRKVVRWLRRYDAVR